MTTAQLALGTVQFGLPYGVAGRGVAVPAEEVRAILARAHAHGIRVLDTAAAYGDIEARLRDLCDGLDFRIVSKLPACPPGLTADAAAAWAVQSISQSRTRLGPAFDALLYHRAEDLLEAHADALWNACSRIAAEHGLRLGVSCYDVAALQRVQARFPVAIAQLPGNALDQRLRLATPAAAPAIEIHLRSAFLQGLLLMPEADAARRVPAATAALARWHAWCRMQSREPLAAALGVAKGMPGVTHCVVGVDSLAQLDSIAAAWAEAPPLLAPELHTDDADATDPRRWPVAA